jgi:hypothetical protein
MAGRPVDAEIVKTAGQIQVFQSYRYFSGFKFILFLHVPII